MLAAGGRPSLWSWNSCGENLYSGMTVLALAVWGAISARRGARLYFGGAATLALLVAQGSTLPLALFYWLVPTFRYSRSDRVIWVYFLAICVLAAMGLDAILSRRRPRSRSCLLTMAMLGLPALAGLLPLALSATVRSRHLAFFELSMEKLRDPRLDMAPQVVEALLSLVLLGVIVRGLVVRRHTHAWLCALLALTLIPLFRFGWAFNPVQHGVLIPESPFVDALRRRQPSNGRVARWDTAALHSNLASALGVADVNGMSNALLSNYAALVDRVSPGAVRKFKAFGTFTGGTRPSQRLLNLLAVDVVVTGHRVLWPRLAGGEMAAVKAYSNSEPHPRFFLVPRAEAAARRSEALDRLLAADFDPRAAVVVTGPPQALIDLPGGPLLPNEGVSVTSFAAHRILLTVRAARTRLLVSSEAAYPGWEARVDGETVPVLTVDAAFRGVVVPAGEHRVEFHYVPRSFWYGVLVSCISLLALGAWVARQRHGPATAEPLPRGPGDKLGGPRER